MDINKNRDWWAEHELLEARLELRSGSSEKAYRRLDHAHALDSLEGYLLFAIAAKTTGHPEQLNNALAKARDYGAATADLAPLWPPANHPDPQAARP